MACYYAFATLAAASKALSGHVAGSDAEPVLTGGATLRSRKGVWLTHPEFGPPDRKGNRKPVAEGVRSKPVVIITPEPVDGAKRHQITPSGDVQPS